MVLSLRLSGRRILGVSMLASWDADATPRRPASRL
jgi:hypothetical protein